jgi:hypothetical protein
MIVGLVVSEGGSVVAWRWVSVHTAGEVVEVEEGSGWAEVVNDGRGAGDRHTCACYGCYDRSIDMLGLQMFSVEGGTFRRISQFWVRNFILIYALCCFTGGEHG